MKLLFLRGINGKKSSAGREKAGDTKELAIKKYSGVLFYARISAWGGLGFFRIPYVTIRHWHLLQITD